MVHSCPGTDNSALNDGSNGRNVQGAVLMKKAICRSAANALLFPLLVCLGCTKRLSSSLCAGGKQYRTLYPTFQNMCHVAMLAHTLAAQFKEYMFIRLKCYVVFIFTFIADLRIYGV